MQRIFANERLEREESGFRCVARVMGSDGFVVWRTRAVRMM